MEVKEYSMGRKLFVAVMHQLFVIIMVTGIFYLGTIRHTHYPLEIVGSKNNIEATEYSLDVVSEENLYVVSSDMRDRDFETVYIASISIIAMGVSLILLAYLTLMAGRENNKDMNINYNRIDHVPSDILGILFITLLLGIMQFIYFLRGLEFDTSGLLVTAGTLTYLIDIPFLFIYLSFVRRIKGDILWTGSLLYKLDREIHIISAEKHWVVRYMLRHIIGLIVGLIATAVAFIKGWYGLFALVIAIIIWDIYSQMKHATDQHKIQAAIEHISEGELATSLKVEEFHGSEQYLAIALNNIQSGLQQAVEESIKNERMKADLITNVSHDIKTPLTSIINYSQILMRENIENENAKRYIKVINEKAERLKQLTEDLVEASRISSGNIKMEINRIDLVELLYQTGGEFNERFEERNLTIVTKMPQKATYILADGRQLYRSIENLYINASKYAMENTRIYVDLYEEGDEVVFVMKNISAKPVENEIGGPRDLTERFVRGEVSRTTEGSGLGLSIAKNLVQLMGGQFDVNVDGDLFIVTMRFSLDL